MKLEELINYPELPSLPEAVIRLNELIQNEAPLIEISVLLRNDPGLNARILKLANSAWFKRRREISHTDEAIALIGITNLYRLVFATSVTRIFQSIDTELVDMSIFWKQSVRIATAAQSLASYLEKQHSILLFTCGILVYIGKLVLYMGAPDIAQKILHQCKIQCVSQYIIENNHLNFCHADISAALMEKWKLPDSICVPIRFYTRPIAAPENHRFNACVLNIAHYMQYTYARSLGLTDPSGIANSEALTILNIKDNELPSLARASEHLYEDAVTMLNL